MKIKANIFSLVLLMAVTSPVMSDIDVITSISNTVTFSEFEIQETALTISGVIGSATGDIQYREASVVTNGADVGVTVIDGLYFYGFTSFINGQGLSDYEIDTFDAGTSVYSDDIVNTRVPMSRSSYSLIIGWSITDEFAGYLGFTSGNSSYGDRVDMDDSGGFFGARFIQRLSLKTSLSYNVAYTILFSQMEMNGDELFDNSKSYSLNADAQGLSFSATWLRSLDRARSFFLRFKISSMEYEALANVWHDNNTNSLLDDFSQPVDVSAEQTIWTLSVGVAF